MRYSLWRNGVRLGDIVAEFPEQPEWAIAGLFRPSAEFEDVAEFSQFRIDELPGAPSFFHWHVDIPSGGSVTLKPLAENELGGSPSELRVELRGLAPDDPPVAMLNLSRRVVSESKGPFPDLCRANGIEHVAWILTAHLSPLSVHAVSRHTPESSV